MLLYYNKDHVVSSMAMLSPLPNSITMIWLLLTISYFYSFRNTFLFTYYTCRQPSTQLINIYYFSYRLTYLKY